MCWSLFGLFQEITVNSVDVLKGMVKVCNFIAHHSAFALTVPLVYCFVTDFALRKSVVITHTETILLEK